MILLLSPAKNMNFDAVPGAPAPTRPGLLKDTTALAKTVKALSKAQLKRLMGVSDKLAALNHERFQAFGAKGRAETAKPAALAFAGDVYRGLDAKTLDTDDFAFAQEHLRILSGLYGLLRPLDAIEPYRLEMGSRLKNPRGPDLYAFWRPVVAGELDKAARSQGDPTIVCLASGEYAGAVDRKSLKAPFLMVNFKEVKDGKARAMMVYVKQARGAAARWAIKNRIERLEDFKEFSAGGYKFSKSLSSDGEWVFTRPQPAPKAAKRA